MNDLLNFPTVKIVIMVNLQRGLQRHGINDDFLASIGPSFGGTVAAKPRGQF
jgi:homoserine acetyltransferase